MSDEYPTRSQRAFQAVSPSVWHELGERPTPERVEAAFAEYGLRVEVGSLGDVAKMARVDPVCLDEPPNLQRWNERIMRVVLDRLSLSPERAPDWQPDPKRYVSIDVHFEKPLADTGVLR